VDEDDVNAMLPDEVPHGIEAGAFELRAADALVPSILASLSLFESALSAESSERRASWSEHSRSPWCTTQ